MKTPASCPSCHRIALLAVAVIVLVACGQDTPEKLVASGKDFIAKKDPRSAAIQLKAALQLDPNAAETRVLLARALMDSSEPDPAILELNKALELGRPKDEIVPLLARALLLSGDDKRLVTQYDALELNDVPANASLRTSVAAAWAALGNRRKAEASLAAALKAVPDFPDALVLQARIAAGQKDFSTAKALLERVLNQSPNHYEALHIKGEIQAFVDGQPALGVETMRKVLAIEPAYPPAHAAIIGLALERGDKAGAKEQMARLRTALPKHPQTLLLDTQIAYFDGDIAKAHEQVLMLLRVAPSHVAVLQLAGAIEAQAGSLVVAESHFVKALQLNPELPSARRGLAEIYLALGQAQRALIPLKPLISPDVADGRALAIAGDAQLRLGNTEAAQALYLQAAKADPNDTRVQTAIAMAHFGRNEPDRGLAELTEISRRADDTFADRALITARINKRQWSEAIAAIDAALKKKPDSFDLLELRGRVHMARNDKAAARQSFEAAQAANPRYFSATVSLASLDMVEKQPQKARERLESAVKADPRNHFAALALADLRGQQNAPLDEQRQILVAAIKANPGEPGPRLALVDLSMRNKRLKDGLQAAQEAATAIPNDPAVQDALGRALVQSGDVQQAISTFKRMSGLDPSAILPHSRLADLYRATNDRQSSENSWRRLLSIDPSNADAQTRLVDLLLSDKREKDAFAFAREVRDAQPKSVNGYLLEGAIHQRLKSFDQATTAYRAGLKRQPTNVELAVQLHLCLTAAGRSADAAQFAAARIKELPTDGNFEMQLAQQATARNDLVAAERWWRGLVERFPNDGVALNNLASTMTSLKRPGASGLAERALAIAPSSPAVMDTLAMALASENTLPRALEVQAKAVGLAPDDDRLRLNLARIAVQAGDKPLARRELEKLVARPTPSDVTATAASLLRTL